MTNHTKNWTFIFTSEQVDTLLTVLKYAHQDLLAASPEKLARTIAAARVKSLIDYFKAITG